MHIVVLGGGGAMGRITVRELAEHPSVTRVTVADLNPQAAQRVVDALPTGREKCQVVACNVKEHDALVALLSGAGAALNATDYYFNLEVMRAAASARVHYADLGGLFHKSREQLALDGLYKEHGLTAIAGIGSTPGITNILARLAADKLERVERIEVRVGSGDFGPSDAPFAAPYSIRTILDECMKEPYVFDNGDWQAVQPLSGQEAIEFPAPVGRATSMYTLHSEVALFPISFRDKGIQHASFKIAFPPEFLRKLAFLVSLGLGQTEPVSVRGLGGGGQVSVAPRDVLVALLAQRASSAASEPADCDILRVIVSGGRDGQPVELTEQMIVLPFKRWGIAAGDADTGIPLAIAGRMLASGAITRRGVAGAEALIDPAAFLRELAQYDMHVTETVTVAVS
ncbi:MAG TPA: saccharopine dehydrogenase NADP-binding domain-containing protein [Ktedonobacterales bacterium]|jgi:saccharopine dehydrogenase-like NADP-dependent oxidoreductase